MPAPENLEPSQRAVPGSNWRRLFPLVALVLLMVAGYLTGAHKLLSLEAIIDVRDHFKTTIEARPFVSLAAFIAFYTLVVSLSVPGASICTLAAGLMFGWLIGGLATVVSATLGASVVFAIARSAFGENLARRAGPQLARMQQGFQDNALNYMLFLRLVPAFPFFIVNIVPAVLGIPFKTFVVGTFFGILPATLTFASIGAGLDSVVDTAKAVQAACYAADAKALCPLRLELATLLTTQVRIALVLLGLLAVLPVVIKAWRGRHHPVGA